MTAGCTDIVEETVAIPAVTGDLTGVLAYPLAGAPRRAVLIVGPHPLMGGRIENNVVRFLGRGLAESGWMSLRFAFSGEGASAEAMEQFWKTGRAPDDPQRAVDACAACAWLGEFCPEQFLLVGYSFGASLLGELADTGNVRGLVMIGATLAQHDYARVAALALPKLTIAADNDFATPLHTTKEWFAGACEPKKLVVVPAAEHFYRGQEDRILAEILEWLAE